MRDFLYRDIRTYFMLQDILNRKARKRDDGDADMRWRMGLGPRPDDG
jgi:hypothetical protein